MGLGIDFKNQSETLEHDREVKERSRILATDVTEDITESSGLHGRIQRSWQRNRDNKIEVERLMLRSLRDRKGEYEPSKLAEIMEQGMSTIFVPTATGKIRAAIAHAKQILLPSGNRMAHGLDATPIAALPDWTKDEILSRIKNSPQQIDENTGEPVPVEIQADKLESMVRSELQRRAATAARSMERKITDQLIDAEWPKALSQFIDDVCTVECAFLKIERRIKPRLVHSFDANGAASIETIKEESWHTRTIGPFDAYWAPGSDCPDKGDFIERLRLSYSDLYEMIKLGAPYNESKLRSAINDYEKGLSTDWMWTDRALADIADQNRFWEVSTSDCDGLHWYGKAKGSELIEMGVPASKINDPDESYEAEAILIGRNVVMAKLNHDPMCRRGIFSTSYEKIPGNIAGNSPARLMRNSGDMINSCARALQNNLAFASGFQVEVDYTRLSQESDPHDLHPHKIWQAKESENTGDRPAVRFFQPDSNANELLGIMENFKRQASADTGIPDSMTGHAGATSQGADATARGQSMLLDNAAQLLRYAIRNIDEDVVVPVLMYLYHWNMRFEKDASIKGDCQIVARGTNAMLQRQDARQNIMAMLEIMKDPEYKMIIGDEGQIELIKTLIDTFDEVDTLKIFPDDDTVMERITAVRNSPPPPDPSQIKAEADIKVAEIRGNADIQRAQIESQGRVDGYTAQGNMDRIIKSMELRAKSDAQDKDIQSSMEEKQLDARARRMGEREKYEVDLMTAKLKATADAKLKIADMRSKMMLEKERNKIANSEPEQSNLDIESAVIKAVEDNMQSHREEMKTAIDQISTYFKDVEKGEATGDVNVYLNMPECTPVKKKITTTRDANGNLQADVTPEIR